ARSATIETVTVDPAREERWNAVEVGGQHDGGKRAGRRDDVAAFRVHGLLGHVKAKPAQLAREPPHGFALTAGCGVDVYQAARERYRIHASSSVRVSVRESRYFTMTGVASDNCHDGAFGNHQRSIRRWTNDLAFDEIVHRRRSRQDGAGRDDGLRPYDDAFVQTGIAADERLVFDDHRQRADWFDDPANLRGRADMNTGTDLRAGSDEGVRIDE